MNGVLFAVYVRDKLFFFFLGGWDSEYPAKLLRAYGNPMKHPIFPKDEMCHIFAARISL